ncbi:MAG: SIMPL domain-containing protein [Sphingomonadales bacterium]|nr:SIMPL domain-containing protein [Sphingomonadales bacterium]
MKPLKTFIAIGTIALAGLAAGSATAAAPSPIPVIASGDTLLAITADGKSTRAPDLAVFSAGVTTQGKTAGEAMRANAGAMNKVFAALKRVGVADKDIQTSNINLNPIYGQSPADPNGNRAPRIVGYQANNTVTVRQRDLKNFGAALDALVEAGANNVNGPSFQIDDDESARDEARVAAMTKARARANLYAKAAGLRVVRIVSISESGGYSPPMPVMYAKAAMADSAPTPVAPGEVETSVNVAVQFELAP